ncbi:MAG: hypothetical protein AAB380_04935, partial [Verrucomicrobiota bacterium]
MDAAYGGESQVQSQKLEVQRKRRTILANAAATIDAKVLHCAARDWDYVAAMDWQQFVSLVI